MSMHPDPVGDLEYNLQQYHKLLEPMLADKADAAIGLRLCAEDPHRLLMHIAGNGFLILLSNMLHES